MHFTEYHTRLAAYAFIVDEVDRVLLTWFNGGSRGLRQCWSLPGGGVEFDERIEDAVVRECYEETGYVVELGDLLTIHHLTNPGDESMRPYRAQRFVFTARIIDGQLGTTEKDGTTEFAQWVPLSDFPLRQPTATIVKLALARRGQ